MWSCRNGTWRHVAVAGLLAVFTLVAVGPFGGARALAAASGSTSSSTGKGGAAAASSTTSTTTTVPASTTTTTVPKPPSVPVSITDGQPVTALLARAVALDSVGVDTSALQAAIARAQQQLDEDAVIAHRSQAIGAQAARRAATLFDQAQAAQAAYDSLDAAVKQAVLLLYMRGPASVTINPAAGNSLAYAVDYADAAITPTSLLATRSYDAGMAKQELAAARQAQDEADQATATAAKALAGQSQAAQQLDAELTSIDASAAAKVESDYAELAVQAGNELVSATSLQFTPKSSIPRPLSTTAVALAWAFSELGKPYVWGATGPNSFDCSGLTQYVWRQAGVAIPRVAAAQYAWTIPVPLSQLLPGDLVFYGSTDIHHVGIYIGDGLMINAPHTGTVVQVSSIWWSDLAGFGRVHAPGTPVPVRQAPTIVQPSTPVVVATAGPVPSQTAPPPGWQPTPGSSTPFHVYPPITVSGPTTTSTTAPASTTAPTTTVPPDPSTTAAPTTSTSTTSTSTTTTSTTTPTGGS